MLQTRYYYNEIHLFCGPDDALLYVESDSMLAFKEAYHYLKLTSRTLPNFMDINHAVVTPGNKNCIL